MTPTRVDRRCAIEIARLEPVEHQRARRRAGQLVVLGRAGELVEAADGGLGDAVGMHRRLHELGVDLEQLRSCAGRSAPAGSGRARGAGLARSARTASACALSRSTERRAALVRASSETSLIAGDAAETAPSPRARSPSPRSVGCMPTIMPHLRCRALRAPWRRRVAGREKWHIVSASPAPSLHIGTMTASASPPSPPVEPGGDLLDVLIVGAGLSGIGAAYHLQSGCPDKTLRDPRGARRRSAAPGTCSATRASAPTPTCSRSATRSGRGPTPRRSPTGRRSCATSARPRASTASSRADPLRPPRRRAPSGRRADAAGRCRPSAPPTASRSQLTCSFLFVCSGYYRYDEGYRPEFAGDARLRGHARPPAALAGGPRLRRQARRGDRQRRDRGHARAGDGGDARRT